MVGEQHAGEAGTDLFSEGPPTIFFVFVSMGALLLLGLLLSIKRPPPVMSDVRIKNQTGLILHNVIINGKAYGDLPMGATSGYQQMPYAYRYAEVELLAVGEKVQQQVIDYVGETPLGEGRFTYVLWQPEFGNFRTMDLFAVKDLPGDQDQADRIVPFSAAIR
jgi:hypothetical protein